MSTVLPTSNATSHDFLLQLLHEQSQLSAVEQFSAALEADTIEENQPLPSTEPSQARFYKSLLPATPPRDGEQFAFEVNLNACSGCKACVVACHTLNGLDEGESWRRVGTLTIGEALPRLQHVPTTCHHCAEPGCLNGCPVKAYDKDPHTGIVRHLDDQCIGCKYCTMMCPYEVPAYNHRLGIVRKCDMCQQRLKVGEAPACVQACPNLAIAIRVVDSTSTSFNGALRLSPGAPLSEITHPTTRYLGLSAHRLDSARAVDTDIDHPADSHWPLVAMLIATQASIGLLLVERGLHLIQWLWGGAGTSTLLSWSMTVVATVMAALGLSVASLHLGQPLRAWRIFLGLRTSWLSREAVLLGKYFGLLTICLGLLSVQQFSAAMPPRLIAVLPIWLIPWVLDLTLVVGLAGAVSSGMIYIATRRQLWRASRTLVRFFASVLCLGLMLAATLLTMVADSPMVAAVALGLAQTMIVFKLIWEWQIHLGPIRLDDTTYDRRSRRLASGPLNHLRTLRLQCGCVACLLAALSMGSVASQALGWAQPLALLATLMLFFGEWCERTLYFSSIVHDRMPGTMP